eukprot:Pgem_evm1s8523
MSLSYYSVAALGCLSVVTADYYKLTLYTDKECTIKEPKGTIQMYTMGVCYHKPSNVTVSYNLKENGEMN